MSEHELILTPNEARNGVTKTFVHNKRRIEFTIPPNTLTETTFKLHNSDNYYDIISIRVRITHFKFILNAFYAYRNLSSLGKVITGLSTLFAIICILVVANYLPNDSSVDSNSDQTSVINNNPTTGTFIINNILSPGFGELEIDNGQSLDAVVALLKFDKPIVAVYIRSGDKYTIYNINDGIYKIWFMSGQDWDSINNEFKKCCSAQIFEDYLDFDTTDDFATTWEISLHAVYDGNATTIEQDIDQNPLNISPDYY